VVCTRTSLTQHSLTSDRVLSVTWTNLDAVTISVGISEDEAIAVPEMLDMQFVHLPPNGVLSRVVQELQLLRCLGRSKIVDEFIVPNWNLPQTQNMPYDCRKQLVELIFSQYSGLSTKSQSALHSLPIVPVERMEEATASKFALPTDLIDQTASDLRALFFDDEEIFPDQGVFTNHAAVLRGIGLKHSFDYDVFIARINHYSSCTKSLYEIQSRIWRMFRLNCPLREADCATQGVNFKTLKWIPTTNAETLTPILTAPIDCRPLNDKLLVNSQMPVWNRFVSDEWLTELGWRENLPKHVLLGQLQHGIKQGNRDVIDAVLEYIAGLGDLDHWQELAELPFIFTGNSYLITPVQAFAPSKTRAFNCDGLQPYFGNADQKFYEHHRVLLDHFGVEAGPDVNHLLTLTDRLASKTHLDDADIAVAVEVSRLATSFPRQTLSGLKILSNTLKFVALEDISFPDAGTYTSASTENLTHPDILHTTVKKLSITKLSERLRDEQLEISDEYDEDYEQHEDMATSIVRTLESYTIESTFNEYLANADDTSKATQLNWLLDGRTHACDNLYDPKLNAAQGPALLVHNDDSK
jgi:sacsin